MQVGILDGTHFLDSLNATTGLPGRANAFDTLIADGRKQQSGLRDGYLTLINQLSGNEIDPIHALQMFLLTLQLAHDQLQLQYLKEKAPSEPPAVRQLLTDCLYRGGIAGKLLKPTLASTAGADAETTSIMVNPSLIYMLLRIPSHDQHLLIYFDPETRQKVLELKMLDIQAEIFRSPSIFLMTRNSLAALQSELVNDILAPDVAALATTETTPFLAP